MRFNLQENVTKENKSSRKPPLEKKPPGLISRFLFCWIIRLFYYGNQRNLDEYDLVPPTKTFGAKELGDLLEKNWIKELTAAEAAGRKPWFMKVIFRTFFWTYLPTGIMLFMYNFFRTGTPLLFGQMLLYWSPDPPISHTSAVYYGVGMILGNLVAAFFYNHGTYYSLQCALKIKIATSSVIFRKMLRMNNVSLGEARAGKIINLLSNDLQRFDVTLQNLNYIWILPVQLICVCGIGYLQAGYSVIIGLAAAMLISIPIQVSFGGIIGKFRLNTARKTDERVQLMNEVISGIQVIKMYAWEIPFQKLVQEKRTDEVNNLRKATYVKTTILGFVLFAERSALFVTILAYILLGHTMSARVIFPLQQFMSAAQLGLTFYLPLVITGIAEIQVSTNRIQDFLSLEDRPDLAPSGAAPGSTLFGRKSTKDVDKKVTPLSYHHTDSLITNGFSRENKLRRSMSFPNDIAVEVKQVSASWTGDPDMLVLKDVSFRLRRGKLCAIIGAVGSGKTSMEESQTSMEEFIFQSSILQMLLKELPSSTGSISVNGRVSYASQDAWLFSSTVRENIIFGLPFDGHKYRKVCEACALEKDFTQFPYGDQSLVGERGVSLSGGQRARINLARAIYRDADIYLLDDPLSAVDASVGRQLFDGCINGYLRGRSRVLVTHQIHFLQAADYIIILNEGRVVNIGSFDELASSGKEFTALLASLQSRTNIEGNHPLNKPNEANPKILAKQLSQKMTELPEEFQAQKIKEEERQKGRLSWEVLSALFKAGGKMTVANFCLVFLVAACGASSDFWITYWTNHMAVYEEELQGVDVDPGLHVKVGLFTTAQYLTIHACIIAGCILMTQLRIGCFVSMCMTASKKLHNHMFTTVSTGVMRFFDTNLSGRILNRFTKDMGDLDESVPRTLWYVLHIYSTLLAILVLNAIALYWTLLPSALVMALFLFTIKVYLNGAQAVKRLEGTTKSLVFNMITSTLNGIATIRSAGAEQRLKEQFDAYQDMHTTAFNCYLGGSSALGLYLDIFCVLYITAIVFIFFLIDTDVGNVGLAITQSYILTAYLQHGARTLVEFISCLTSVERVLEYTKIDTEDNLFIGKTKPPLGWPSAGNIEFRGVYLRYDVSEAPVLKDLNFIIQSGWKVGIVGRTGAGKSSLISALFRFANMDGTICIDAVDISLVSRQELRSKISIIPQEPVLFPASIRYNLDPFNIYSDDEIWRALEQVELKSAIPSLDFNVTEGGSNFSVGQRQLMCLARALLRSNKILVMDEATANVDPQTDAFIQKTIRRLFASCTVLTIAHRLNTVMDSDRVLVMGTGRLLEFDHPHMLLKNPNSTFSAMVRETGENISSQLYKTAEEHYTKHNAGLCSLIKK